MSGPWFIAPSSGWSGTEIRLPPEEAHHARVLRVGTPDVITVTDGKGSVARCAVRVAEPTEVVAEILEQEERRRSTPEIVVYQGAAKGHKNDEVIERLAELAVAEVSVFSSERSVVRWDRAKSEKLAERWGAIARSAAKQSRNPYVCRTSAGLSFTELQRRVAKEPLALVLWEEAMLPLRTALVDTTERLALVVGPEGGLSQAEAESLADAGGQLVSLGPHILRTEVAPVVAVSALMYHYGLIG